jgi:hypothetical protein
MSHAVNTETMRKHFEADGSPARLDSPHAPALALAHCSAFRPCPGHYTRENWLAYRVIAQLSESGLDINHSPAVQVWDVAHREIIAWMEEHGIKTGLRTGECESSPNDQAQTRST